MDKTAKAKSYCYLGEINNGHEPYFKLELWFLTSYDNKLVWALNREHLNYLIDYLSADLREKTSSTYTIMKTQADHLPRLGKRVIIQKKDNIFALEIDLWTKKSRVVTFVI
ncbi:hypothetical protein HCA06_14375 [Listeria welshimeri]|nr:hypothetical protein [Listeria welshimeri]